MSKLSKVSNLLIAPSLPPTKNSLPFVLMEGIISPVLKIKLNKKGTRIFHFKFQFRCNAQELNSAATQHLQDLRSLNLCRKLIAKNQTHRIFTGKIINTCALSGIAQVYFGCDLRLTVNGKCFSAGCIRHCKLEMIPWHEYRA